MPGLSPRQLSSLEDIERYYPVISETPPIASRRIPPSRRFAGFSQLHTIRLNAPVEILAADSRFLV